MPPVGEKMRLGHVQININSIDEEIDFYEKVVGMTLNWKKDGKAGLGAGKEDLLVLRQVPGRRRNDCAGIYHFALELPSRNALGLEIQRLLHLGWPNNPTDHTVSKSTYLSDPEGNEIEIYTPTPEDGTLDKRKGWTRIRNSLGEEVTGREPLDVEKLLSGARKGGEALPKETKLGHVHLYVSSLEKSMEFYTRGLGFEELTFDKERFGMADVTLFGYLPHRIAFNIWRGEGIARKPENSPGLDFFTLILPGNPGFERVKKMLQSLGAPANPAEDGGIFSEDPSGNRILIKC